MKENRYLNGLEMMKKVHGEKTIQEMEIFLDLVSPEIKKFTAEWIGADIYMRPGLDIKTREIITLSALIASKNCEPQIENHIRSCLNVGLTKSEIYELILQLIIICGFPTIVNTLILAHHIFEKLENEK